jgi:hypothetical protein
VPSGTVAEYNKIIDNDYPLYVYPISSANEPKPADFEMDASPNWWGSIAGPYPMYNDVDYDPWCGDEACSFTVSATEGEGDYYINAAGQIVLSGTVNVDGGIVVNEPGLKFLLTDGTIIENNSPCFTINADNTKITTESIGGATCVPTNGSNGIDVAGGLTDIIIEGIEIDGKGEEEDTGDGINFAGAVTGVILRDNFIHDLDGDGVVFSEAPAGTVQVQGNLFMDNDGFGLNAPSNLDVTYNAWGDVDGPESGVDLPTVITSSAPWTHVDLFLNDTGTTLFEDEVLVTTHSSYDTITYEVKANLMNATGADFELSYDDSKLEVVDTNLGSVFTTPVEASEGTGSVIDDSVPGVISFAGYSHDEQSGEGVVLFEVTFKGIEAGTSALSFGEDMFSMAPENGGPSVNIYATELADGEVLVRDHFSVIGTVSMQGRSERSGVLMTLSAQNFGYGPFSATSTGLISSNNLSFSEVVEDLYLITIEQDRYLDVTSASNKTIDVNGALSLAAIELLGGDVNGSDAIGVDDASVIGGDYGRSGTENTGDANFDGVVNIQDLALVGGNFDLTSANAYVDWLSIP